MSSHERPPDPERLQEPRTPTPLLPDEIGELYNLLIPDVQEYAIFLLDPAGRVVSWNAGAENIKGYTEEEILGQHFSVFYPADEASAGTPEEHLAAAARDGRAEYEGWRVRKDGSQFWASVVSTAITDDEGRLRGFGKVTRDLTERRGREQENLRRSLHDDLTDLPNRVLLGDRLDQALSRLERRDTGLAVLFIDVNDFKRVNDTYGHESGDIVLVEVAQRLRSAVRPEDTVGRMGGDEFVVVCEDLTGAPAALAIAERVIGSFVSPVSLPAGQWSVSASIGIAMTASSGTPAQVMLRRADTAMYEAKRVRVTTSRVHLADDDDEPDPALADHAR